MNLNGQKKPQILLVDSAGPETDALLKALKKEGLDLHFNQDTQKAFEFCINRPPTMLIAELEMPLESGVRLIKRLKSNSTTRHISIMVTAKEAILEERLKSLQIGIDDYVSKPYYPEEVVARVESILQEIESIAETRSSGEHGFSGNLEEMNLVDLIQTLELGNKSGVIYLMRNSEEGRVYVEDGKVIDAQTDGIEPEQALTNMLTWLEGSFKVSLQLVDRVRMIKEANREILQNGTKLIHQWRQIANQLPPLTTVVRSIRNGEGGYVTKLEKELLSLFSEPNTILSGIESSKMDDLRALELVKSLLDKGLLIKEPSVHQANDPLAKNILERIQQERRRTESPYSRIASFFKRKSNAKIDLEVDRQKEPAAQVSDSRPQNKASVTKIKVPHRVRLTKGELLLIRQKILAN